jgi:hypothetical protein
MPGGHAGSSPRKSRFLEAVYETGEGGIVYGENPAQFAHGPAVLFREQEQDTRPGRRHPDIFPHHDIGEVIPEFLLCGENEINKPVVGGHRINLGGMNPPAYLFGIPNNKCQTKIFFPPFMYHAGCGVSLWMGKTCFSRYVMTRRASARASAIRVGEIKGCVSLREEPSIAAAALPPIWPK